MAQHLPEVLPVELVIMKYELVSNRL